MESNWLLTRAFLLLLAGLVSACGSSSDLSDLENYVDQISARPKGRIEAIPNYQPAVSYRYTAETLRSPFQPPATLVSINSAPVSVASQPSQLRKKEYLEQFALADLMMVGTLSAKDGRRWALVKAPDGGVSRVKQGDYLGLNNGLVTAITNTQLSLLETAPNNDGGWIERQQTLSLIRSAGEQQ